VYTPSHFAESRPQVLDRLVHDHPLGLVVSTGPQGLDANPVPFLLDRAPDGSAVLRAHVARGNPLWKEAAGQDVLVVFQGPQAYVTPNWYPSKAENGKAVPTWNYILVQARGRLVVHDDPVWLRAFLERLTQRHEASQARPWAVADAPDDYLQAMLRGIVGIEIPAAALSGKWKMSQNHAAQNRDGVVKGLRERGGDEAQAVARWVEAGAAR
jgi:transcriptional regulator